MNINKMVDKEFENKTLKELVHAPVYALQGLTPEDARLLKEAFGVDNVGELAKQRFFRWAQAIVCLAEGEE